MDVSTVFDLLLFFSHKSDQLSNLINDMNFL